MSVQPYDNMNKLALELLAKHDVVEPPINIYQIIHDRNIKIFWYPMTNIEGVYDYHDMFGPSITINQNHASLKQRFSAGHELKHDLCDRSSPHPSIPGSKSVMEKEANAFAASLLMPEHMVRAVIDQFRGKPSAKLIAEAFWVNHLAAIYRLQNLGIFTKTHADATMNDGRSDEQMMHKHIQQGPKPDTQSYPVISEMLIPSQLSPGLRCSKCSRLRIPTISKICGYCGSHF